MFNRFIKRHISTPTKEYTSLLTIADRPQQPTQNSSHRHHPYPPHNSPTTFSRSHHTTRILMQIDGTPGNNTNSRAGRPNQAGVAVVIRDEQGRILYWLGTRAPAQTNNEAEYQALILGLKLLISKYKHACVTCLTDSQLVINLSTGQCNARSPRMIALHSQATKLTTQIQNLSFVHIPREANRLADALAWEALFGTSLLLRHLTKHNPYTNAQVNPNEPAHNKSTLSKEQSYA